MLLIKTFTELSVDTEMSPMTHYDVIKWNIFLVTVPFVRGIHWSPVFSSHKEPSMFLCCQSKQSVDKHWIDWQFETPRRSRDVALMSQMHEPAKQIYLRIYTIDGWYTCGDDYLGPLLQTEIKRDQGVHGWKESQPLFFVGCTAVWQYLRCSYDTTSM